VVVTAFLVESYKNLKENPNETAAILLARIATRLENTNISSTTFPAQEFSPTHSDIRVNTFWFLSLVLSLTTVLVRIVSLQWLREHQMYPEDFSAEQTFTLLHMRTEMFQKWCVAAFFMALPVLLQVALLLFFVGLAEFLVALNNRPVAIPVVAAIALSITFLITTTALPGLYLLFVTFKPSLTDKTIPVPNPYKSPQAELSRSALSFVCLHVVQPASSLTTSLLVRIPWCHKSDDGWYKSHREWYKDILPFQSWRELDLKWMFIRRESLFHLAHRTPGVYGSFRYTRLEDNWWPRLNQDRPFYDQLQAIMQVYNLYPSDKRILHAVFHCFLESLSPEAERFNTRPYFDAVERLLHEDASQWHINTDDVAFLTDHILLLFLHRTGMAEKLGRHYLIAHELHFHIRNFFFRVYVLQRELITLPPYVKLYSWDKHLDGRSFSELITPSERKGRGNPSFVFRFD